MKMPLGLFSVHGLDEGNVVALEHDPPDFLHRASLEVDLGRVVQHQVHVLVEAHDVPLDARVDVLVKPHRDPGSILEKPEDQVDGLNHHFLHFLRPLVRHFRNVLNFSRRKFVYVSVLHRAAKFPSNQME